MSDQGGRRLGTNMEERRAVALELSTALIGRFLTSGRYGGPDPVDYALTVAEKFEEYLNFGKTS